jgi:hypothetical protein
MLQVKYEIQEVYTMPANFRQSINYKEFYYYFLHPDIL